MSKNFSGLTPAGETFARAMLVSTGYRACVGNRDGTKTRISFECGIDANQTRNSDAVASLLLGLAQHTLFDRFSVTDDAAWNGVAQPVGTIDEQDFTVLFDDNTCTQDGGYLAEREQSNHPEDQSCQHAFNLLDHRCYDLPFRYPRVLVRSESPPLVDPEQRRAVPGPAYANPSGVLLFAQRPGERPARPQCRAG